jgi:hypothetical protein
MYSSQLPGLKMFVIGARMGFFYWSWSWCTFIFFLKKDVDVAATFI